MPEQPRDVQVCATTLPAQDVPAVLERVRYLEQCGFDMVQFPDTQGIYPDPFVAMAAAAARGSRLRLTTSATNPVTRHPSVVATAIGGVQELAPGGAFLTLATGDSALINIGRRNARLADLRAFVQVLRDIYRSGEGTFEGGQVRYQHGPTPVPIHISAHGPRSLELAGELADGVWIGLGIQDQQIQDALGYVARGAARSGRTLADLELGCYVRCYIGDDAEHAREILTPSLAAVGHYALSRAPAGKGIPEQYLRMMPAYAERYDTVSHATGTAGSANSELIRELGLVDYLAERFALIGPPETVAAGLRRLRGHGITSLAMFFRGPETDEQMQRFGHEVMPAVRAGKPAHAPRPSPPRTRGPLASPFPASRGEGRPTQSPGDSEVEV